MHGIDAWLEKPENLEQIPESQRETLVDVVFGAAQHPTLKEVLEHVVEDEARTARVHELDDGIDPPVDIDAGERGDVMRDEWDALTGESEDRGVDQEA